MPRFLTEQESITWLGECGWSTGLRSRNVQKPVAVLRSRFWISQGNMPMDRQNLATVLCSHLETGPALFLATDWGMWCNPEEKIDLIQRFRSSFGEARRMIETPGVLLESSEFSTRWQFAALFMLLDYNLLLVPAHGDFVFEITHDDDVRVDAWDADVANKLSHEFNEFNCQPLCYLASCQYVVPADEV